MLTCLSANFSALSLPLRASLALSMSPDILKVGYIVVRWKVVVN